MALWAVAVGPVAAGRIRLGQTEADFSTLERPNMQWSQEKSGARHRAFLVDRGRAGTTRETW